MKLALAGVAGVLVILAALRGGPQTTTVVAGNQQKSAQAAPGGDGAREALADGVTAAAVPAEKVKVSAGFAGPLTEGVEVDVPRARLDWGASTSESRRGRITVVAFVHANCCGAPGARARLDQLAARYAEQGVDVYRVEYEDYAAALDKFVRAWSPEWSAKTGKSGRYAGELREGVRLGPGSAFVFDRDGGLREADIHESEVDWALARLEGC